MIILESRMVILESRMVILESRMVILESRNACPLPVYCDAALAVATSGGGLRPLPEPT